MPDVLEEHEIQDVEALKALADPKRLSLLLATTHEPKTVKMLATELDVPPTRLYYHVKMLESHGLLQVAKTRMVSGIEERSYQATAKSWSLSQPLLSSVLVRTGVIKAVLDMTAAELALALERTESPIGEAESAVPVLSFTKMNLDPKQAEDVQRRIQQMMIDFGDPARKGQSEYHAFLTVYRRS